MGILINDNLPLNQKILWIYVLTVSIVAVFGIFSNVLFNDAFSMRQGL